MKYKNPSSTTDMIVEQNQNILLIKRKSDPFKNKWALPGGFLEYGKETLEKAAVRELREETSLVVNEQDIILFGNYSHPNRDPRGHIISHVYIAKKFQGEPNAGDDAKEVKFFPLDNLPAMAFDHEEIITDYIKNRYLRL